jgi:hypothetical protein
MGLISSMCNKIVAYLVTLYFPRLPWTMQMWQQVGFLWRKTYEIESINVTERIYRCESVGDDGISVLLPLELVNSLVENFGS